MNSPAAALAVLAAVVAAVAVSATTVPNCGLQVGNQTIDLSPLHTDNAYVRKDSKGYIYKFQVCGPVGAAAGETCKNISDKASMYQFGSDNKCSALECLWDDSVQWKLIDAAKPNGGIMYTVKNGPDCNDEGIVEARVVNWKFVCDPNADTFGTFSVPENEVNLSSCETTFEITTKDACLGASTGPDDDDDDDDDGSHKSSGGGGLSGGWVFVIILLVTAVVYCAAGAFLNHRKGATGADLCPNGEFWRGLPGLVKDGCRFTSAKIGLGGGSSSDGSYDTM